MRGNYGNRSGGLNRSRGGQSGYGNGRNSEWRSQYSDATSISSDGMAYAILVDYATHSRQTYTATEVETRAAAHITEVVTEAPVRAVAPFVHCDSAHDGLDYSSAIYNGLTSLGQYAADAYNSVAERAYEVHLPFGVSTTQAHC